MYQRASYTFAHPMVDRFTKVFESILDSSIWFEDSDTVKVWFTLMALADAQGHVDNTVLGLASRALPGKEIDEAVEITEAALEKFQAPDKYSRTPDHEGRRIKTVDGGWFLYNHKKYREKQAAELRKAQNREAQQRKRDKGKAAADESAPVSTRQPESAQSAQAEAEAEAEAEAKGERQQPRTREDQEPTGATVAKSFNSFARRAAIQQGNLTAGTMFPYIAHRAEFDEMAMQCRQVKLWGDFLGWWWRAGGWAADRLAHATPKACLKGWQASVQEHQDPDGFAKSRRRAPAGAAEDPRHGGEAFRPIGGDDHDGDPV